MGAAALAYASKVFGVSAGARSQAVTEMISRNVDRGMVHGGRKPDVLYFNNDDSQSSRFQGLAYPDSRR